MILKIKNKFLISVILIVGFLLTSNYIFAYDEVFIHPSLTGEMAKLYNLNYNEKLTDQEIEWMKKGSKDEDARQGLLIRSGNHFFNPFGVKKWADDTLVGNIVPEPKLTAKEWLHNSLEQDSFPGGDFTWERAIWDYANGDKQHAYESLGHIAHLIEDSTVPAHTRNDLHISPNDKDLAPYQNLPRFEEIKKVLQDGEPYEAWTGKKAGEQNLKLDFALNLFQEKKVPLALNIIDEYFDNIAKYTNTKFFSKDTIYAYSEPNNHTTEGVEKALDGKTAEYVYGFDENNNKIKLAKIFKDANTFQRFYGIYDDTPEIHSDYWYYLAPRAVLTGTGIIKLFKIEANKAIQNPQSIKRPKSIASVYGPLAPAVRATDSAIRQIATVGQLAANAAIYFFSSSAKAQLEFDVSNSVSDGIYTIEELIEKAKKITVAQAEEKQEPFYAAKLSALSQNQNQDFSARQEIGISAEIENIGAAPWRGEKISLNLYIGEGLAQEFYHSSWLTRLRPADLGETQINPGEKAVFNFVITAPSKQGSYFFRARAVRQDEDNEFYWLGEYIVSWPIRIKAPETTEADNQAKNESAFTKDSDSNEGVLPAEEEKIQDGAENNPPAEEDSETNDAVDKEATRLAEEEAARLKEEEERIIRRRRAWATVPPNTAIIEFPENPAQETSVGFKFSSDKNPSTFLCSLDEAEFAPCEEETFYENLSGGDHILKVKAKDGFGNIDETPAEYSWRLEAAKNIYLVISEIQAGTSEYGAEDEFVELYNPTDQTIDLAGWELRKKNSSGNGENLVDNGIFGGEIAPHGFFLIAHKNYKGFAAPDLWYSTSNNLSYENNSVMLYNEDCQTGAVVDEVVYSEIFKGLSLERKALKDGVCVSAQAKGEFLGNGCDADDQNDFEIRPAPNPQNSASIAEPAPTPAHNITSGLDYPSIQWAINSASPGDEIHADSGVYHENVNINKRLVLKGVDTGGGNPTVDGGGNESAITISADESSVEGFNAINSDNSRNWYSGIAVRSDNNSVKNNNVSNNYYGISLKYADNNVLSGNIANSNAYDGIVLAHSNHNTVENNTASSNSYGIQLGDDSYSNTISGNIANFNINAGLFIVYGYDNILTDNTVKLNAYGIFIFSGVRNKIYHNNFIDSIQYNVDDKTGIWNNWDDGYPNGGNYWSDYSGLDFNSGAAQDEAGSDGIGDTAYWIYCDNFNGCQGGSQDRYPLMKE